MMLGYQMNATIVLSLMTSLTLGILVFAEKRYRLFNLLAYIPHTKEHELKTRLNLLIDDLVESLFDKEKETELKKVVVQFEESVINLAVEAADGNKKNAAKLLHIGEATLHRKLSLTN